MVREKVTGDNAYIDCISAVIDEDERDFTHVHPAVRVHEVVLHTPALERATSSKRKRDIGLGDEAT